MTSPATYPNLTLSTSYRQILSIALPISFSIFVPQINFITNNIFLGGLGEESLAQAGITGVYYLIFAVMGFGLNNGLQALIARRAGQQNIEDIGKIFAQSTYISLAFAFTGILITYVLAPIILPAVLRSGQLTQNCLHFLQIRIIGLPFLYLYQMRNALLVGTNQSKLLIWGTLAETITNIVLDYGLIYGHFGLPRLGFNGAAIASVIAEFVGMGIVFLVIEFKGISKKLLLHRDRRFSRDTCRLILDQSAPLIFQYAISIISWEFFYILIEHYGARDLAISNTMRNIFGTFGVFTWAFAATCSTMVSNVIGQGLSDQVPLLIRKIVRLSMLLSGVLCLLLNIFPHQVLSLFGQNESFIRAAIPVMRVVSVALMLMSFATVWLNAVTGTGNTKINLIIEFIAIIAYSLYVFLVLRVFKLPITIGWMAEWLYWAILFGFSFQYIGSNRWRHKKV
jgi:multidrug resistance protein, MATE family